jgi:hypothetical protein
MQNVSNKKYILIGSALGIILILFLIGMYLTLSGQPVVPTAPSTLNETNNKITNQDKIADIAPAVTVAPTFHNLIPGKTSRQTTQQALGNPTKTIQRNDYTADYYSVSGTDKYTLLIFKQNSLQYVVEQKPNAQPLYINYRNQTHKQEDGVLYDPNDDGTNAKLYVYSHKGIAFVSNPDNDQTTQVHYFIPTDYQTFLLSVGAYLSFLTPPAN